MGKKVLAIFGPRRYAVRVIKYVGRESVVTRKKRVATSVVLITAVWIQMEVRNAAIQLKCAARVSVILNVLMTTCYVIPVQKNVYPS